MNNEAIRELFVPGLHKMSLAITSFNKSKMNTKNNEINMTMVIAEYTMVFAFPSPFEINVATAVGNEKEESVRIKTKIGLTKEYIPIASCPKKRVKIILDMIEMHFALTPIDKIENR